MTDTNAPPAASERMTAERIATFLGEIENIAALLQRTWTGGSVSDPVADVLANAANLIRTLSARAEAAEARAERARAEALEEAAKVSESLETIGDAIGPSYHQGKAFAARYIANAIRALAPQPAPTEGGKG